MPSTLQARASAATLALAGVLLTSGAQAAPGTPPAVPAALPNLGSNVTVDTLAAGSTLIVRPASGSPVAAIELWYRAPSTGFGTKPQIGIARLAAQTVVASRPFVGDALSRVVQDAGGRLTISVYGDSVAVTATTPSSAARTVVKAMTTAFFAPVVSDEGFGIAKRDVSSEAFVAGYDPEAIVRDAVFADLFASGPQHFPALGDPKNIATITEDDVRSFSQRAFRAGNATLVVSGAVDASIATAAAQGRPGDVAAEVAVNPDLSPSIAPVTKDAQPPGGGYGWIGPAIASEREATAMDFIADYLFRPEDGVISHQVAEKFPDAFVTGQFITLHDPGVMFVAYSGSDQNALRGIVDAGFASVRTPLDPAAFQRAKASFQYHILSDLQTPTQIADNYGWYVVEGAPEYAPGARGDAGSYAKAADSLTPEFIASVAQKYLARDAAAAVTLQAPARKGHALPVPVPTAAASQTPAAPPSAAPQSDTTPSPAPTGGSR